MIGEDLILMYQTFKKEKMEKFGFEREHAMQQNNRISYKRTAIWEYLRLVVD